MAMMAADAPIDFIDHGAGLDNSSFTSFEERNEKIRLTTQMNTGEKILMPLRSFLQGGVWSARSKPMLQWTLYKDGRSLRSQHDLGSKQGNSAAHPSEPYPQDRKVSGTDVKPNTSNNSDIAITVRIGTGTGQPATPFSVTSEHVLELFKEWGFSARFLRKLKGKAELFEHHFSRRENINDDPQCRKSKNKTNPSIFTPDTLEVAISSFEVNSLHIFGIYSLTHRTAHFLLFIKASAFFNPNRVRSWLDNNIDILLTNPILVPNILTTGIQLYVHSFGTWRALVNDMEARIGVTTENKLLQTQGYTKTSEDLDLLNNALSTLKKIIAEHELATATMVRQTKALMRVVEIAERFDGSGGGQGDGEGGVSEAAEELYGTMTRAEIYLQNLQIMQNILQNHTAALYNRINQHDNSLNLAVSQSMKTIAVVTLLYLPPTFVATLFSTSIFDFGMSGSSQGRHVSQYWWILATICILLTLITMLMWALWYKYGRQWTDSLLTLVRKKDE